MTKKFGEYVYKLRFLLKSEKIIYILLKMFVICNEHLTLQLMKNDNTLVLHGESLSHGFEW